jgi:hypothetical protein
MHWMTGALLPGARLHIGTGIGDCAAEVVEQHDGWTWCLRALGSVVATGEAATAKEARAAAERAACARRTREA